MHRIKRIYRIRIQLIYVWQESVHSLVSLLYYLGSFFLKSLWNLNSMSKSNPPPGSLYIFLMYFKTWNFFFFLYWFRYEKWIKIHTSKHSIYVKTISFYQSNLVLSFTPKTKLTTNIHFGQQKLEIWQHSNIR